MREEKLLGKTRCKHEKSVLRMVGDCLLATYCVPKENKVFNSQRGLYRLMVWCFCKIDVCTWNVRLTYSTIPISIKIRIFYFSLKHQLPLQTRYTAHYLILFNIANFQPCSRTTKSGCFIAIVERETMKQLGYLSSHMLHSSLPCSFLSHSSFIWFNSLTLANKGSSFH